MKEATLPVHVFTLVIDREPTDEEFDALVGTGCDDAAFGVEGGLPVADFDREAPTMADAVVSAVRAVDSVGLKALRVIGNDLMTLADIADRAGRSRESVRRYATGERGGGSFPPPVNPARAGTAFYRWSEVAPWLREHVGLDVPDADEALVVVNLILQARQTP